MKISFNQRSQIRTMTPPSSSSSMRLLLTGFIALVTFCHLLPSEYGFITTVLAASGKENETIAFDGQNFVLMDLRKRPVASFMETILLRLKTNHANGNILFSRGTQGDMLALQLVNNKLVFSLDLGGDGLLQSVSAGSLLDDNIWHDVNITRHGYEVIMQVDQVTVRSHLKGDYMQLNLNRQLYFGGIPLDTQFDSVGEVRQNYTGCIENFMINQTDVIREIKDDRKQYVYQHVGQPVSYFCISEPVSPVTFLSSESHFRVDGYMVPFMNCSFHFRTFNPDGLLLFHKFSSDGFVKLYLTAGFIEVQVQGIDTPIVTLRPFDMMLNDGLWHPTTLLMEENLITLMIDGKPSLTRRRFGMTTGHTYLVGGGQPGMVGFMGCMRWIFIEGRYVRIESLPEEKIFQQRAGDIQFDMCTMTDRCHPNPCEHGGNCRQSNTEFSCDCSTTGYHGAVCHVSRHPISCEAFHLDHPRSRNEEIELDVDGSGPLEPFPVTCIQLSGGRSQTVLHHQTEQDIEVRGYNAPGSYVQDIEYHAPFEAISELVNHSYSCKQFLNYACQGARLLNTPPSGSFEPYSWWISRNNQKMDYWGGSLPGSRKCQCGLYGNCRNPNKWCNCDSSSEAYSQGTWLSDAGDLTQKEYLPVRQIRVGDTGLSPDSKQAVRYRVGPLSCEGNNIIDNTVTFRYEDATINLPSYQFGLAADVYLQFKTTTEFGVLLHSRGESDFIKLRIMTGKTMQFEYSTERGVQSITVESPVRLNDNKWHSVLLERNPIEARLLVDGKLSAEQRSRTDSATKPLNLTSDFVIGATVDHREGYVGCIRSFMIDGRFVDLVRAARRVTYGVSEGCSGKCESSPCLNEGTCMEGYSGYSCDCQWTAFKGPICADEIGVNLRSDNYIRYDFEATISTLEETIRVGFTTTEHRGLIVGINSHNDEYMNLLMSNSGHLRLVFDFGFERQEIIIKNENFALGQHHDITIKRSDRGAKITLWVDNYEPIIYTFRISPKADAQFNQLKSIYVGRNETMPTGDGFVGCISRVSFDDHFPLRRLFQENRRSNVHAYPSIESLREDSCGIEPVTHPTELPETRPPPTLAPGVVIEEYSQGTSTATIVGIVAGLLLAILIFLLILFYRNVTTDKGDYVTYEDTGARQAADADTAVVRGKTGHDVAKVKEYFI